MKISVITPTFNSEKTIKENVLSIVNQSYKNYEQIIIDNLSNDKTIELIKNIYNEYKIVDKLKIISEKDNGIAEAFNKGIKTSSGDLITILNSDDYFYSNDVFEKVIRIFSDENILFTHGNVLFIDEKYGTNIRRPLLCSITKAFPYNHPGMFIRKKIYDDYGLFDESFKYAMDYEFICRLNKNIPEFQKKGFYIQGEPMEHLAKRMEHLAVRRMEHLAVRRMEHLAKRMEHLAKRMEHSDLIGIAVMRAGGVSWQKELDSIYEVKQALQKNQLWNYDAKKNFIYRWFRIKIKIFLNKIKLNKIINIWRNWKWRKLINN